MVKYHVGHNIEAYFAEYWTDEFGLGHNPKGFSYVHYYKNGLKLHTEKQIYGRYHRYPAFTPKLGIVLHDRYYYGKKMEKRLRDLKNASIL